MTLPANTANAEATNVDGVILRTLNTTGFHVIGSPGGVVPTVRRRRVLFAPTAGAGPNGAPFEPAFTAVENDFPPSVWTPGTATFTADVDGELSYMIQFSGTRPSVGTGILEAFASYFWDNVAAQTIFASDLSQESAAAGGAQSAMISGTVLLRAGESVLLRVERNGTFSSPTARGHFHFIDRG